MPITEDNKPAGMQPKCNVSCFKLYYYQLNIIDIDEWVNGICKVKGY